MNIKTSKRLFTLNWKSLVSRIIIPGILCFGPAQSVVYAGASLLISPTRVVFEERTRTAQVTLMNNGNEVGNYRISFINQNMTDDGNFEPVEEGTEGMFSDKMIRYSPRQVTLPAGQSQVIRLMLRKPRDLQEGEYRSHMLFQSLPKPSKSSIESAMNKKPEGITVEIVPIVGISIPVIIRHGRLSNEVTLSNASIKPANENKKTRVAVTMSRSGDSSVYGDFRVMHIKNGLPTIIGQSNGVAVYTPNPVRHYEIPLTVTENDLSGGEIRIVYLESGKNEENGLLAETRFSLN